VTVGVATATPIYVGIYISYKNNSKKLKKSKADLWGNCYKIGI